MALDVSHVLIVYCGLIRDFRFSFLSIQRRLIDLNPRSRFDVAIFTDPEITCTSRSKSECACQAKNVSAEIAKVVARPVVLRLLPSSALSSHRLASAPGALAMIRLADAWSSTLRWLHMRYTQLVVLRPDAEVLRPLDLSAACNAHPELTFITGSVVRPGLFHNRDTDWALLACSPRTLGLWLGYWLDWDGSTPYASCASLASLHNMSSKCPRLLRDPSLRPGRVRTKRLVQMSDCQAPPAECVAAILFSRAGARFDTMDREGIHSHLIRLTSECVSRKLHPVNRTTYGIGRIELSQYTGWPIMMELAGSTAHAEEMPMAAAVGLKVGAFGAKVGAMVGGAKMGAAATAGAGRHMTVHQASANRSDRMTWASHGRRLAPLLAGEQQNYRTRRRDLPSRLAVASQQGRQRQPSAKQQNGRPHALLQTPRAAHSGELLRDGGLTNLSALLNGLVLPRTTKITDLLDYWITSQPAGPLVHKPVAATQPANCADALYSDVLTSQRATVDQPSLIVDFVPFGFDLDMLEVRLVENFDVVDAFVVYESTRTHHGHVKKAYFNETRFSGRWNAFESKLLHFIGTDVELAELRQWVRKKEKKGKGPFKNLARCSCFNERSMRMLPVLMFSRSGHPLAVSLRRAAASGRTVLALQNDADELVSLKVLHHLRLCQLRTSALPAYAPSTSYWMSFEWLRRTCPAPRAWGIECVSQLERSWAKRGILSHDALSHHLHVHGPTVLDLARVLREGYLPRYNQPHMPDLGPGAAIHLSNVAEPVHTWLKSRHVLEGDSMRPSVPASVVQAVRARNVTPAILRGTLPPLCHTNIHKAVHVSTFVHATRELLFDALPAVVRANPQRYPFMSSSTPGAVLGGTRRCCSQAQIQGETEPVRCCWSGLGQAPDTAACFAPGAPSELFPSGLEGAYGRLGRAESLLPRQIEAPEADIRARGDSTSTVHRASGMLASSLGASASALECLKAQLHGVSKRCDVHNVE